MKRIKTCHSLAWLLALPMMMWSLASQANYNIGVGPVSEGSNTVTNPNGGPLWTYAKSGDVENFGYSQDANSLSFYMPASGETENSLTLTTVQTFSGRLQAINLFTQVGGECSIELYVGQEKLGTFKDNGKVYNITALSYVMADAPITLKFVAPSQSGNAQAYASVSGLSKVEIAIDETVAPLPSGQEVSFDPSELSTADMSNYTYHGILFTLNNSESGDGFEAEDGGIYIGSVLTDAAVATVNNNVSSHAYSPGDPGYAADFAGGITLLVPKGKGYISIEAQNESTHAFHVKIGGAAPVEVSSLERDWLEVPYDVENDTYIYIYMVQKASGTRIGRRATAHGVIYKVKCASAPTLVPGDANGSGGVDKDDVQMIADYILGKNPAGFKKAQANVDGEGDVTVVDLVKVIGIILSQTP